MEKHNVLLSVLLLCFASFAACGRIGSQHPDYARGYAQSSPLKLEIKTARTMVKNKEEFSVDTALRNSGSEVWILEVWSCGYNFLWAADNPSVHVIGDVGCMRSFSTKKYLKPGEVFESAEPVFVELAAGSGQPESVTFRLGFKDPTFLAVQKIPPIWSNAVTVAVTR